MDKVEWRHVGLGRKKRRLFRVTATLPASVEDIAEILRDVNGFANWNRTVQVKRLIFKFIEFIGNAKNVLKARRDNSRNILCSLKLVKQT